MVTQTAPILDTASQMSLQADLGRIREAIYLGGGYHVVRNYLTPSQVEHIVWFWQTHHNARIKTYNKSKLLYQGCPDMSQLADDKDRHFNFFWNKPLDMFTYSTAWRLQALRNQVEGNPPGQDFLPHYMSYLVEKGGRCISSYRVSTTRQNGAVDAHIDWPMNHARVQLSLMLTSHGEDYRGGFLLNESFRGGKLVNLCEKENLRAGDLVVFRYSQEHGVSNIQAAPGKLGFSRILMPHETIQTGSAPKRWVRRLKRSLHPEADEYAKTHVDAGKFYYDEETERLMQIAIRQGFEPAEVYFHRGLWARFKLFETWQVDALKRYGLKPHHQFLDVGCGIMRLGIKLVQYLDDDHYCGVDPLPAYIELGHTYLREIARTQKQYRLECNGDFNFAPFQRKFDFAMAHSVFTHLSFDQIKRCMTSLKQVMAPGGQLVFTIQLGKDREESFVYAYNSPMVRSTHKDLSLYETLGREIGFKLEHLGKDGHPTQEVCKAIF
jgi:SAM-dependent methyltransferase